jgi:hypothetical protein
MLEPLLLRARLRKLRLFGAACLRRGWDRLTDERSRQAVEVAERYADGEATEGELAAAGQRARVALHDLRTAATATSYRGLTGLLGRLTALREPAESVGPACALPEAAAALTDPRFFHVWEVASLAALGLAGRAGGPGGEAAAQCALLRDLFGGRMLPGPIDPPVLAWNDRTVVRLARAMYEARDFRNVGLLADALLDAGCADEDLLAHCRSGGEHVRGCFAVDAILWKE